MGKTSQEDKGIRNLLWAIGGVSLGAALMYLFDPDRGKHRRALIRNKCTHSINQVRDAIDTAGGTCRDLTNRSIGLLAETRSLFRKNNDVDDDILVARVRSRLGHITTHTNSIEVIANHGEVTLSGSVPVEELNSLLTRVAGVPGVKEVESRLKINHSTSESKAQAGSSR